MRRKVEGAGIVNGTASGTALPTPEVQADARRQLEEIALANKAQIDAAAARVDEVTKAAGKAVPAPPFPGGVERREGGDVIDMTSGEEVYGQTGTYSSYRVAPVSIRFTVRAGQTREEAAAEGRAFLEAQKAIERVKARDGYLGHFKVAFQKG